MKTSNQTKLERQSGRKIKQGDTSSIFCYQLTTHDEKALSGPARVQLIHIDKGMLEIETEVIDNVVEFQLEKALPVGTYTIEIEHGGYVFPSSNSETIVVNENLGEYVSNKDIELYSLKEIVKKYVEETKEENTPDLLLFYNLGKV